MPSYRRSLVWLLGIYFKRPWSLSHTLFFCQVFFFLSKRSLLRSMQLFYVYMDM